jgi:hypothetical protein
MNWLRIRRRFIETGKHRVARWVIDLQAEPADRKPIWHAGADAEFERVTGGDRMFESVGVDARDIERAVRRDGAQFTRGLRIRRQPQGGYRRQSNARSLQKLSSRKASG